MDANEKATDLEAKLLAAKEAAGGGEMLVVETDIIGAEVLGFRVPKADEWKAYRVKASDQDPTIKVSSAGWLVHTCVIFPTAAEFQRIVEAHPGLVETCIGELVEHAGAARAKKVRKL
jgi:hypothetical protein